MKKLTLYALALFFNFSSFLFIISSTDLDEKISSCASLSSDQLEAQLELKNGDAVDLSSYLSEYEKIKDGLLTREADPVFVELFTTAIKSFFELFFTSIFDNQEGDRMRAERDSWCATRSGVPLPADDCYLRRNFKGSLGEDELRVIAAEFFEHLLVFVSSCKSDIIDSFLRQSQK